MLPNDVLRMGPDAAVLFVRDAPHPILAGKVRYFMEAAFAGLWDRWRDGAVPPLMIEHKGAAAGRKAAAVDAPAPGMILLMSGTERSPTVVDERRAFTLLTPTGPERLHHAQITAELDAE